MNAGTVVLIANEGARLAVAKSLVHARKRKRDLLSDQRANALRWDLHDEWIARVSNLASRRRPIDQPARLTVGSVT